MVAALTKKGRRGREGGGGGKAWQLGGGWGECTSTRCPNHEDRCATHHCLQCPARRHADAAALRIFSSTREKEKDHLLPFLPRETTQRCWKSSTSWQGTESGKCCDGAWAIVLAHEIYIVQLFIDPPVALDADKMAAQNQGDARAGARCFPRVHQTRTRACFEWRTSNKGNVREGVNHLTRLSCCKSVAAWRVVFRSTESEFALRSQTVISGSGSPLISDQTGRKNSYPRNRS